MSGYSIVRSIGKIFTPTITVTASSAYSAGDSLGGLITIPQFWNEDIDVPYQALLDQVVCNDVADQSLGLDLLVFNDNPSASTITDHEAVSIAAADAQKLILRLAAANFIDTSGWTDIGAYSRAQATDLRKLVEANSSGDLYVAFELTSTPTMAATTNFSAQFHVLF